MDSQMQMYESANMGATQESKVCQAVRLDRDAVKLMERRTLCVQDQPPMALILYD
jgi:hypothetical protein